MYHVQAVCVLSLARAAARTPESWVRPAVNPRCAAAAAAAAFKFKGLEPTRLTTVVEMEMEEGGIREDRAEGLVPVEGQQGYCLLQVPALEARRVALQARLRHCLPVQFVHPDKGGTVHLGLPLFCESSMCSESRPCPKDHRRVSSR